jgi:hypothetical protein
MRQAPATHPDAAADLPIRPRSLSGTLPSRSSNGRRAPPPAPSRHPAEPVQPLRNT